jgi:DNA polymerase III epsilon subunit-like protein/superfamily I DNA/RNA helicase/predicted DNA-binding transcriptional regulator YafY
MASKANAKMLPARRVTDLSALEVVNRDLKKTKNSAPEARAFSALRAVSSFISLASKNKVTVASLSNTDLLPMGHPLSTTPNAMTASALRNARAQWIAADPMIDESVRPLVATAHSLEHGSIERRHAFARLSALGAVYVPITAAIDPGFDAPRALIAFGGFGLGGNSSAARRARAMIQRRDRKGRFAEQGGGFNFNFNFKSGSRAGSSGSASGRVVGAGSEMAGDDAIQVEFVGVDGIPNGIYNLPASKGEATKAVLTQDMLRDAPNVNTKNIIGNRADAIDTDNMDNPMAMPDGWTLSATNVPGAARPGFLTYQSDDGYFAQVPSTDPYNAESPKWSLRRANLTTNGVGGEVASGSSWADIQAAALKDQDDYEKVLQAADAGTPAPSQVKETPQVPAGKPAKKRSVAQMENARKGGVDHGALTDDEVAAQAQADADYFYRDGVYKVIPAEIPRGGYKNSKGNWKENDEPEGKDTKQLITGPDAEAIKKRFVKERIETLSQLRDAVNAGEIENLPAVHSFDPDSDVSAANAFARSLHAKQNFRFSYKGKDREITPTDGYVNKKTGTYNAVGLDENGESRTFIAGQMSAPAKKPVAPVKKAEISPESEAPAPSTEPVRISGTNDVDTRAQLQKAIDDGNSVVISYGGKERIFKPERIYDNPKNGKTNVVGYSETDAGDRTFTVDKIEPLRAYPKKEDNWVNIDTDSFLPKPPKPPKPKTPEQEARAQAREERDAERRERNINNPKNWKWQANPGGPGGRWEYIGPRNDSDTMADYAAYYMTPPPGVVGPDSDTFIPRPGRPAPEFRPNVRPEDRPAPGPKPFWDIVLNENKKTRPAAIRINNAVDDVMTGEGNMGSFARALGAEVNDGNIEPDEAKNIAAVMAQYIAGQVDDKAVRAVIDAPQSTDAQTSETKERFHNDLANPKNWDFIKTGGSEGFWKYNGPEDNFPPEARTEIGWEKYNIVPPPSVVTPGTDPVVDRLYWALQDAADLKGDMNSVARVIGAEVNSGNLDPDQAKNIAAAVAQFLAGNITADAVRQVISGTELDYLRDKDPKKFDTYKNIYDGASDREALVRMKLDELYAVPLGRSMKNEATGKFINPAEEIKKYDAELQAIRAGKAAPAASPEASNVSDLDAIVPSERRAAIDAAIADKKDLKFEYHEKDREVTPLDVWTNPKNGNVNLRGIEHTDGDKEKNFIIDKIGKPVDEKIKQAKLDDIIDLPQEQLDDVVDALWPARQQAAPAAKPTGLQEIDTRGSTAVSRMAYSPEQGSLFVQFTSKDGKGGGIYRYDNVGPDFIDSIATAESVGKIIPELKKISKGEKIDAFPGSSRTLMPGDDGEPDDAGTRNLPSEQDYMDDPAIDAYIKSELDKGDDDDDDDGGFDYKEAVKTLRDPEASMDEKFDAVFRTAKGTPVTDEDALPELDGQTYADIPEGSEIVFGEYGQTFHIRTPDGRYALLETGAYDEKNQVTPDYVDDLPKEATEWLRDLLFIGPDSGLAFAQGGFDDRDFENRFVKNAPSDTFNYKEAVKTLRDPEASMDEKFDAVFRTAKGTPVTDEDALPELDGQTYADIPEGSEIVFGEYGQTFHIRTPDGRYALLETGAYDEKNQVTPDYVDDLPKEATEWLRDLLFIGPDSGLAFAQGGFDDRDFENRFVKNAPSDTFNYKEAVKTLRDPEASMDEKFDAVFRTAKGTPVTDEDALPDLSEYGSGTETYADIPEGSEVVFGTSQTFYIRTPDSRYAVIETGATNEKNQVTPDYVDSMPIQAAEVLRDLLNIGSNAGLMFAEGGFDDRDFENSFRRALPSDKFDYKEALATSKDPNATPNDKFDAIFQALDGVPVADVLKELSGGETYADIPKRSVALFTAFDGDEILIRKPDGKYAIIALGATNDKNQVTPDDVDAMPTQAGEYIDQLLDDHDYFRGGFTNKEFDDEFRSQRAAAEAATASEYNPDDIKGLDELEPIETEDGGDGFAVEMFDEVFDTPPGAYKPDIFGVYVPKGRTNEVSIDFTDDPKQLATRFGVAELGKALSDAILPSDGNDATGYGSLKFASGDEPIKAEAILAALKENDVNPDIILAGLYDRALGDEDRDMTNMERVMELKNAFDSEYGTSAPSDDFTGQVLDETPRDRDIMLAKKLNERLAYPSPAQNAVIQLENFVEPNQNLIDLANDLMRRQDNDDRYDDINLAEILDQYLPLATSADPEEREEFRGLWGMMMSLDGGSSHEERDLKFSDSFRSALLSAVERTIGIPDESKDAYDELISNYGGYPEFVAGKKAIATGVDDLTSTTSAAAFYRLVKAAGRPNDIPLYRSIGVRSDDPLMQTYTTVGSTFDIDPRSFTSASLQTGTFGDAMYSPTDPEVDHVIFRVAPGKATSISAESLSWFVGEQEHFAYGSYRVTDISRQPSRITGRPDDFIVTIEQTQETSRSMSDMRDDLGFLGVDTYGDISDWERYGESEGSNPGGFYRAPDGSTYYAKQARSRSNGENEALASAFYQEFGIRSSVVGFGNIGDELQIITPLIPGAQTNAYEVLRSKKGTAYRAQLHDGFAIDAWLSNYDVTGLNYDNIVTDNEGNAVRLDPGGALMWRATGGPKDWFGDDAFEFDNMRDKLLARIPASAEVFGSMTDEQLKNSARRLLNITPGRIDEIVDSVITDKKEAEFLKETLKRRRDYILAKTGLDKEAADSDILGEPTSLAQSMGFAAQDLQPGDITAGDSFTISRIFRDSETPKGKVSVEGYYPGHELQRKEWNENTEISAVRGGKVPEMGTQPALHRPKAPYAPKPPAFTGPIASLLDGATSWEDVKERLRGKDIIVFDYETTGFPDRDKGDFSTNQPVSIGAVRIRDGKPVDYFNMFMNPGEPLGLWARENLKDEDGNPLTDATLQDSIPKAGAHSSFVEWAGPGAVFAAHNAPFDMGVFNSALEGAGIEYQNGGVIDTLKLAQQLIPSRSQKVKPDPNGPERHTLGALADFFGINIAAPATSEDAMAPLPEWMTPEERANLPVVEAGESNGWHTADADAYTVARLIPALLDHISEQGKPLSDLAAEGAEYDAKKQNFDSAVDKYTADLLDYETKKAIAAAWNCKGGGNIVSSAALLAAAGDDDSCSVPTIDEIISRSIPDASDFVDPDGISSGAIDGSSGSPLPDRGSDDRDEELIPLPDGIDEAELYSKEKFQPTAQQRNVVRGILSGDDVVVLAKAGTGKTTTLNLAARVIQKLFPKKRILYMAFNRNAAEEARGKMPANVEVRTADSVAYSFVKTQRPELFKKFAQKDTAMYSNVDIAKYLNVPSITLDDETLKPYEVAALLRKAIYSYLTSADESFSDVHLLEHFPDDAVTPDLQASAKAWIDDIFNPKGQLPFSFGEMKKIWSLSKPDFSDTASGINAPVDLVFLDEAQDTNDVLGTVIRSQNVQAVLVGDPEQAIYQFMGAKDQLQTFDAPHRLPLTESWRYGPEIGGFANRFLAFKEKVLGYKNVNRGLGRGAEGQVLSPGTMENPDAIIARSNAGAFIDMIRLMDDDKVVGVPANFMADIKNFVDSVEWLKNGGMSSGVKRPANMPNDLRPFKDWAEVEAEAAKGEDSDLGVKTSILVDMVDEQGVQGLRDVIKKLRVFGDKAKAQIKSGPQETSDLPDDLSAGAYGNITSDLQFAVDPTGVAISGNGTYAAKETIKKAGAKWDAANKQWKLPAKNDAEARKALTKLKNLLSGGKTAEAAEAAEASDEMAGIDVVVATAHQMKGLEFGNVRASNDFRGPRKDKTTGEMIYPPVEEIHLAYVVATRAQLAFDPGSLSWIYDFTNDADESPFAPVATSAEETIADDVASSAIPMPAANIEPDAPTETPTPEAPTPEAGGEGGGEEVPPAPPAVSDEGPSKDETSVYGALDKVFYAIQDAADKGADDFGRSVGTKAIEALKKTLADLIGRNPKVRELLDSIVSDLRNKRHSDPEDSVITGQNNLPETFGRVTAPEQEEQVAEPEVVELPSDPETEPTPTPVAPSTTPDVPGEEPETAPGPEVVTDEAAPAGTSEGMLTAFDALQAFVDTDPEMKTLKESNKALARSIRDKVADIRLRLESGSISLEQAQNELLDLESLIPPFVPGSKNNDSLNLDVLRDQIGDIASEIDMAMYGRAVNPKLPPPDKVDDQGRPLGVSKDGVFLTPGMRVRDKNGYSGTVEEYNKNDWLTVKVRFDLDPRDPEKIPKGNWGPGVARMPRSPGTLTTITADEAPWVDPRTDKEKANPKSKDKAPPRLDEQLEGYKKMQEGLTSKVPLNPNAGKDETGEDDEGGGGVEPPAPEPVDDGGGTSSVTEAEAAAAADRVNEDIRSSGNEGYDSATSPSFLQALSDEMKAEGANVRYLTLKLDSEVIVNVEDAKILLNYYLGEPYLPKAEAPQGATEAPEAAPESPVTFDQVAKAYELAGFTEKSSNLPSEGLIDYITYGTEDINGFLMAEQEGDSEWEPEGGEREWIQEFVEEIDKIMDQAPKFDVPVTVYRGTIYSKDKAPRVGQTIESPRYLSTSLSPLVAEDFTRLERHYTYGEVANGLGAEDVKVVYEIEIPPGEKFLSIPHFLPGIDATLAEDDQFADKNWQVEGIDGQQEILLARDSEISIVEVTQRDDGMTLIKAKLTKKAKAPAVPEVDNSPETVNKLGSEVSNPAEADAVVIDRTPPDEVLVELLREGGSQTVGSKFNENWATYIEELPQKEFEETYTFPKTGKTVPSLKKRYKDLAEFLTEFAQNSTFDISYPLETYNKPGSGLRTLLGVEIETDEDGDARFRLADAIGVLFAQAIAAYSSGAAYTGTRNNEEGIAARIKRFRGQRTSENLSGISPGSLTDVQEIHESLYNFWRSYAAIMNDPSLLDVGYGTQNEHSRSLAGILLNVLSFAGKLDGTFVRTLTFEDVDIDSPEHPLHALTAVGQEISMRPSSWAKFGEGGGTSDDDGLFTAIGFGDPSNIGDVALFITDPEGLAIGDFTAMAENEALLKNGRYRVVSVEKVTKKRKGWNIDTGEPYDADHTYTKIVLEQRSAAESPEAEEKSIEIQQLVKADETDTTLYTPETFEDFLAYAKENNSDADDDADIEKLVEGTTEWYSAIYDWLSGVLKPPSKKKQYEYSWIQMDSYAGKYSDAINQSLRDEEKTASEHYPTMQGYLMETKLPEGLTLYRGVGTWDGSEDLEEGSIVTDRAFQSFATAPRELDTLGVGQWAPIQLVTTLGPNVRGAKLSQSTEQEVLLPAGIKYRIDEITQIKGSVKQVWKITILEQGEGIDFSTGSEIEDAAEELDATEVTEALDAYANTRAYEVINTLLRTGETAAAEYLAKADLPVESGIARAKAYIDSIDAVIEGAQPIGIPATFYRGVGGKDVSKFFDGLEVGDTYRDLAYVSTTTSENRASSFPNNTNNNLYIIEIVATPGTKGIYVADALGGEGVAFPDQMPEDEFLMARGTEFRVISKDDSAADGRKKIKVEAIAVQPELPPVEKVKESEVDAANINPQWQVMPAPKTWRELEALFDDYYGKLKFSVDPFINEDVTDEQERASSGIWAYQGDDFFTINGLLRNQIRVTREETGDDVISPLKAKFIIENIYSMDMLFKKAPTIPEDMVLYRGIHSDYSDELMRSYEVGDLFQDSAYGSATIDLAIAEEWASSHDADRVPGTKSPKLVLEIVAPAGTRAIYLPGYLGGGTDHADEHEVTFDRGTTFRVISKIEDADGTIRVMRVAVVDQTRDSIDPNEPWSPPVAKSTTIEKAPEKIDFSTSIVEGIPSLRAAVQTMSAPDRGHVVGLSALADGEDIEDLEVRVNSIIDKATGENRVRLRFKLTHWALEDFKDNRDPSSGLAGWEEGPLEVPSARIDDKGNVVIDDELMYNPDMQNPMLSSSPIKWAGKTYKMEMPTASKDSDVNISVIVNDDGQFGLGANSFDGMVHIDLPRGATEQDIIDAMTAVGVRYPRPSTKEDLRVLVENKMLSLFAKQTDATTYERDSSKRAELLKQIADKWGITADDVTVEADRLGVLSYVMPDAVGEALADTTGVASFTHVINFYNVRATLMEEQQASSVTGLPRQTVIDATTKYLADFIESTALRSTITRVFEGNQESGQSSAQDISYGSADYVFTTPSADEFVYTGATPSTRIFTGEILFESKKLLKKLGAYANYDDDYGKRVEGRDILDAINVNSSETLFKHTLDLADASRIAVGMEVRAPLIKMLKDRGIANIGETAIEDFVIEIGNVHRRQVEQSAGIGVYPDEVADLDDAIKELSNSDTADDAGVDFHELTGTLLSAGMKFLPAPVGSKAVVADEDMSRLIVRYPTGFYYIHDRITEPQVYDPYEQTIVVPKPAKADSIKELIDVAKEKDQWMIPVGVKQPESKELEERYKEQLNALIEQGLSGELPDGGLLSALKKMTALDLPMAIRVLIGQLLKKIHTRTWDGTMDNLSESPVTSSGESSGSSYISDLEYFVMSGSYIMEPAALEVMSGPRKGRVYIIYSLSRVILPISADDYSLAIIAIDDNGGKRFFIDFVGEDLEFDAKTDTGTFSSVGIQYKIRPVESSDYTGKSSQEQNEIRGGKSV